MRSSLASTIIGVFLMALPATESRAQIVINEVLQNPNFVDDTNGEWIELFNVGTTDVDINGWTIRDDGTNVHVIDNGGPLIVPSEGFLVLGRSADPSINGNVPVSYSYGSAITLGNAADQVILEDQDGIETDRIEYDDGTTFPDPTGASMELISPLLDNSIGLHWSEAVTAWSGNDFGTPGSVNSVTDSEPPHLVSVSALTTTEVTVMFNEAVEEISSEQPENYAVSGGIGVAVSASRDSNDFAVVRITVAPLTPGNSYTLTVGNIRDLTGNVMQSEAVDFLVPRVSEEGDILITEIMKDPDLVTDSNGEWFEVYNTTAFPVDMFGWVISDGGSNTFTIEQAFIVPSRGFAVFTVNSDSATNGGLDHEPMHDWGSSSTFTLGNTDDKIIIRFGSLTIDSVSYDGGVTWPDTLGASLGLMDFTEENNLGQNWSIAPLREPNYGGVLGDLGSPGTLGANQSTGSAANIQVTPDQLMFYTGANDSYSSILTIQNTGNGDLTWALNDSSDAGDCSWLSEAPTSGITPAGGASDVSVTVDAVGLEFGSYDCSILVSSSDPLSPLLLIPVTLQVLDTTLVGSVSIAPEFLPIPAAGDTVPMKILLNNLVGVSQNTELWVTLLIPGATAERLMMPPRHPEIAAFDSIVKLKSLRVPSDGPGGTYLLTLHLGSYPDSMKYSSTFSFEKLGTGRFKDPAGETLLGRVPLVPFLDQNYPNPFNLTTHIRYGLPEDTWVTIKVYNILGQEILTLVDEFQPAGFKSLVWSGQSGSHSVASSGIYIYRISAGIFEKSGTMILIK